MMFLSFFITVLIITRHRLTWHYKNAFFVQISGKDFI